jgi:arylsulfatase A-like enzyme
MGADTAGGGRPPDPGAGPEDTLRAKTNPLALALLAGVGGLALVGGLGAFAWPHVREALHPRPPDVIFVVMDTVRADHLHACGYERPNTPVLDAMKASGWAVHCAMISPAPWTIPSHLTYFTGQPYVELRQGGEDAPIPPTLAQKFQAEGYDTAFLSANMVLKKEEWFTVGFRQVRRAKNIMELRGDRMQPALEEVLDRADPDKPLFLFVNLIDAHSPYPPIPQGVGWVEPQRGIQHRRFSNDDSPFQRYMTGRMTPEEAADYQRKLFNGYDYGISLADQNVGVVLETLRAAGRLDRSRIVVSADHGELLGEHNVIGHGDTLYEPGLRVPLFFWDAWADNPVSLPKELSGAQLHDLILRGQVGAPGPRYATSYSNVGVGAWNAVALWPDDATKLVWKDGETFWYDLSKDPGETQRLDIGEQPARAQLDEIVQRNLAVIDLENAGTEDEETKRLLEAAGYLAPD